MSTLSQWAKSSKGSIVEVIFLPWLALNVIL